MDTGRPGAAIERLRRLLDADPEREGWHRQLMRAYAQAGERALALRQFHACRATLRGRLGIEPSAETRELYASLL
jgi:DNA-binding SARP family transcriptional activator